MINPSANSPVSHGQPIQDPDDQVPQNQKGKTAAHTVEKLNQVIQYSGIAALITAVASVFFLVRSEDEAKDQKIGDYAGNCYVIAEVILVVAVVALISLKIFMKVRGA